MLRRRKFLSLFTLTAAAAAVNFDKLAGLLGITKSHLRSALSFDFHVFEDNLTNLHFYFINAKVTGDKLVKEGSDKAYMVVRLPQQHISEQEFRENTITDNTIALSKLSGF